MVRGACAEHGEAGIGELLERGFGRPLGADPAGIGEAAEGVDTVIRGRSDDDIAADAGLAAEGCRSIGADRQLRRLRERRDQLLRI